jgi:hypothetical protein
MDSLGKLLGQRDFSEPPEVTAIKHYVRSNFKTDIVVTVRPRDIVISAPSAALVNTLRLRSQDIKRQCQLDKRLVFRIG